MEILILGLILVAFMVWASTRIKRSAARAFEAEHVEGDGFSIDKPEGFLNRHYDSSEYLFDAYTKDFGTGQADKFKAATAVVFSSDASLNEAAALEQSRLLNSDRREMFELEGQHSIVVVGEEVRDGQRFEVSEKFLECGGKTLVLKVEAVPETSEDLTRKIDEMLASFSPK